MSQSVWRLCALILARVLRVGRSRTRRELGRAIASLFLLMSVLLSACSSAPAKPVLYPNDHFKRVGEAQAQQDIRQCTTLAREAGLSPSSGGQVGHGAATGAAIGGAAAAAASAVLGGDVLRSAGAGAAAGGAGGAVHGATRSQKTDPVFENFVARCLKERGFEVIGWK